MELAGINPLYLIAGLALLGLAPFLLMMVTSYVKIVVVTSLVRNALGVQQVPPAMVMNGLAIILTVFIMAPVAMDTKALPEAVGDAGDPAGRLAAVAAIPGKEHQPRHPAGIHGYGPAHMAGASAAEHHA